MIQKLIKANTTHSVRIASHRIQRNPTLRTIQMGFWKRLIQLSEHMKRTHKSNAKLTCVAALFPRNSLFFCLILQRAVIIRTKQSLDWFAEISSGAWKRIFQIGRFVHLSNGRIQINALSVKTDPSELQQARTKHVIAIISQSQFHCFIFLPLLLSFALSVYLPVFQRFQVHFGTQTQHLQHLPKRDDGHE